MTDPIRSLIIGLDRETARQIDYLARQTGTLAIRWRAESVADAVEIVRSVRPDMAIVDLHENSAAEIGELASRFPQLFILALCARNDEDLVLQTVKAGAHDCLCQPIREVDLRIVAEKAGKFRLQIRREFSGGPQGQIVSVFSNKGGNGATTIAANLAEALVRRHRKKVAVADLALSQGDVTMFFNVSPTYSILELAKNAEMADYEFLHSLLVRHPSGVYVLAEPPAIEDAEPIAPEQVRQVLSGLRSMFDIVLVDTPHQLDDRTLAALEMSDIILLVSLLNLPSMKNTQRSLELFERLGLLNDRVRLVLSRYLPDDEISKESIEGIMNRPIFFAVPNDYPTVISSVNRGKLLSEIAPGKEITTAFGRMSDLLIGPAPERQEVGKRRGFMERIFRPERTTA